MKNRPLSYILFAFLFISLACEDSEYIMADDEMMMYEDLLDVAPSLQEPPREDSETDISIQSKKVIKTGGIDFQSNNIEKDYKSIRDILPKFQAYIEDENQTKTNQRISYSLSIRVPSRVYDTLYSSLTDLAFQIDYKYSNIVDVTERYYDLKTRIKNKITLEQRYVSLLDKATEIKDILEIERNLNNVRIEIERFQGQFNYLSKQVNFSTIELSFYEILPYVYDSSSRKGFGARILSAIDNGWQAFLSFVVGFASLWPLVLLLAAGILLFKKFRIKWKRKNPDQAS